VSTFAGAADLGGFIPWAFVCIVPGMLAIGASFLIRGDIRE
jgi:hypothetical protein